MSTFTLTIATDNAAFSGNESAEVARILRKAAKAIAENYELDFEATGTLTTPLRDANGNRVGEWAYEKEDAA